MTNREELIDLAINRYDNVYEPGAKRAAIAAVVDAVVSECLKIAETCYPRGSPHWTSSQVIAAMMIDELQPSTASRTSLTRGG